FMTTFGLIQPVPTTHDPIFAQLLGALESGRWAGAEDDVREAARARLDAYYCNVLRPDQRKVFDDWVAEQAAKTGTPPIRDSSRARLRSSGAKCQPPSPLPGSAAGRASRGALQLGFRQTALRSGTCSVERTESVADAADRLERPGAIAHLPSQPADDRLDD